MNSTKVDIIKKLYDERIAHTVQYFVKLIIYAEITEIDYIN